MNAPVRILWAVNVPLPAAAPALGLPASPFGGWLSTMTQRLARVPDVQLGVVMRSPVRKVQRVEVDGVCYYALPQAGQGGMDARPEECAHVLNDFKPDLLHANGSEMPYTLRLFEAWGGLKLVSLQGVLNGYEPFETGGVQFAEGWGKLRLKSSLSAAALMANKRFRFMPRLDIEREIIRKAGHVMGRTTWDRAQAWAMSPLARYHHGGETLRVPFYGHRWHGLSCNKHEIFIGSCASPRKGAHVALSALALLKGEYPDVRMVIAGDKPGIGRSIHKRIFGYSAYFQSEVDRLDLSGEIEYSGLLQAQQMAERMSRSHVFLLPSLIENSPNTLGEAMLLGMPCVTAFTGGTPSMAQNDTEALFYRAEDAVELAFQIKRMFDSDALCIRLGNAAHERALKNHDPEANLQDLLQAYSVILGREIGHAA